MFSFASFCVNYHNNTAPLMTALHHFPHIILDIKNLLSLSYRFTKKRPLKIFKIEKINRQTGCKRGDELNKISGFQS